MATFRGISNFVDGAKGKAVETKDKLGISIGKTVDHYNISERINGSSTFGMELKNC